MVFLDWMSEQDKVGVGVLAKRTVSRSVSVCVAPPNSFLRLHPPPLLRCKLAPYPMCVIGISPFPLMSPSPYWKGSGVYYQPKVFWTCSTVVAF